MIINIGDSVIGRLPSGLLVVGRVSGISSGFVKNKFLLTVQNVLEDGILRQGAEGYFVRLDGSDVKVLSDKMRRDTESKIAAMEALLNKTD